MARIVVDISPSVDGYVAGPGVSVGQPFGDAGMRLHRWIGFDGGEPEPDDEAAARSVFDGAGAVLLGRTMFDVGIGTWGPDGAFGLPVVVVTHRPEPTLVRGPTTFSFVTGLSSALDAARAAAGDRTVVVAGGASIVRQLLALGLVDELRLHVVPVLLGSGAQLFADVSRLELRRTSVVSTAEVTHLTYVRA